MKRLLVAGVLFVQGVQGVQAQNADSVLNRAVTAYGRVQTMRAQFVQAIRDPMLGDATSRGELLQQRPRRFSMRWTQPRGDMLVADGDWLWIYLPSSAPNQVVKSSLSGRGATNPDIIGDFLDRPRERFNVSWVRAENVGNRPADVLALVPKQPRNLPYSRVLVWIDQRDDLPHQVEITEASGQVRRITLDRIEVNPALAASVFTFRAPAGARIIDASSN